MMLSRRAKETVAHVSQYRGVGRVETMQATIGFLDKWLEKVGTDPAVRKCIVWYAQEHGFKSMKEVCKEERLRPMAREQDKIGWRQFMEGMVAKHILLVQDEFHALTREGPTTGKWASQLVCRLLEVVHGQWVYQNIQVYDESKGSLRTLEKEKIQREIKMGMVLGFDGFLEADQPLALVTLEDIESSGGRDQEYWLLAVRAARTAKA
jgi:hypothetical protein